MKIKKNIQNHLCIISFNFDSKWKLVCEKYIKMLNFTNDDDDNGHTTSDSIS
jgi:hypothetical protein